MIGRLNALVLRFTATPLGFNLYASVMCADPALLVLYAVSVPRTVRFLWGLI